MLTSINPKSNIQAFIELVTLLKKHWQLTIEMTKREINDRYAGQVFGLFWTFGHPLILIFLYVFIFGYVFKSTIEGPYDFVVYLLAGLIPWLTFQEVMFKSSVLFINNVNIVKQIIFPVVVLPVKTVLASILTQIILFGLLLIYVFLSGGFPKITYILLPLLVIVQMFAMVGASFLLSSASPFLRDTKDFVQIFATINFFAMPMLYTSVKIPLFKYIFYFNPFSYMIWCYQDALFFGQFRHPWAWLVFIAMSLLLFIFGYRFFRKIRLMIGNVL